MAIDAKQGTLPASLMPDGKYCVKKRGYLKLYTNLGLVEEQLIAKILPEATFFKNPYYVSFNK